MNLKIIVVGLIAITIAASLWFQARASIVVQTAVLQQEDMRTWLFEKAKTSLPRTYAITMPLGARVLPISLVEGDRVHKGQVIAKLDRVDLESAVAEAAARLSGIKARIRADEMHSLEDLALSEHKSWMAAIADVIEAARQKERASEARLEYAKWWLDSQEKAVKTNATPVQMLREARMQSATADVSLTSDRLATSAMLALETAFRMFPSYVSEYLNLKTVQREDLVEQMHSAQLEVDLRTRDAARAQIVSPVDGVILRRFVQDETVLNAGTPLLELGDLGQLELITEVLTREALQVQKGQAVEILGLGDDVLHGVVQRVRPKAFTKLSSLGVEQQRVEVVIAFEPEELAALARRGLPLGVGYRARVRLFTAQKDSVLTLPRRALVRASDKHWQVYAVRDGRAVLLDVELGLVNERQAEVTRGLESGERVILSPPATLVAGARVSFAST